jgi:phytoene dehydrogenase-like protein
LGLTEQYQIRFPDGRCYTSLFDMLTSTTKKAYLKAILTGRARMTESSSRRVGESAGSQLPITNLPEARGAQSLESLSAAAYIAQFSADPDLLAAVEAIAATASGLSSQDMPASEYIQITLDGREAGQDFAMPTGGVRAIIKALTTALRRAGGELFVRTPVEKILIQSPISNPQSPQTAEKAVGGIRLADGRTIRSRVVIHNGGPSRFLQLVGADHLPPAYLSRLTALKGVECAALFGATCQPLFTDTPIVMTPGCRRIVGIFSPTFFDPHLSKTGLHLFDAFFPLHSADRTAELELALADLRDLFPHFDETVEWTVPMFFTGAWPGTESGQTFGQTGDNRLDPTTPIQNCYLVGMDLKGSGVAGDLIPLGVRQLLTYLNHRVLTPTPEFGAGFK